MKTHSHTRIHIFMAKSYWVNYWLSVSHPWPVVATHVPVQCLRAISADSKETDNMIADHWEAGSPRLKGLRDFFKWFSALTSCWVKLMCTQGAVIYFSLFQASAEGSGLCMDVDGWMYECEYVCVCVSWIVMMLAFEEGGTVATLLAGRLNFSLPSVSVHYSYKQKLVYTVGVYMSESWAVKLKRSVQVPTKFHI